MSRICANCGKGAQVGNSIPNSKLHTKRRFQVNFQKARIKVNGHRFQRGPAGGGGLRRMLLCSNCLSLLHKQKLRVRTLR